MARSPYPLQWPDGWRRTPDGRRGRPQFQGQFARDRDAVIRQLKRRGCSQIVITSDLPTRNDGLPYANARCSDPGIAVWWVERGRERVMACDRWRSVDFNMRAIDLSIEAMRGLDRWGASDMVERAFAGFAALPAGDQVAPPRRTWAEVFDLVELRGVLHGPELLAVVKQRHRERIRLAHPDAGGDPAIAAELNAALDEAEKELGGG